MVDLGLIFAKHLPAAQKRIERATATRLGKIEIAPIGDYAERENKTLELFWNHLAASGISTVYFQEQIFTADLHIEDAVGTLFHELSHIVMLRRIKVRTVTEGLALINKKIDEGKFHPLLCEGYAEYMASHLHTTYDVIPMLQPNVAYVEHLVKEQNLRTQKDLTDHITTLLQ